LHPTQHAAYIRPQLAPGASIPSDQLAVEALRRAEARAAELDAAFKAFMLRAEERERQLHQELQQEREKAREREHAMQIEMLRQQITQTQQAPKQTGPDMVQLVTALAPVFGTMFAASKDSSTKSLEVQQQGLQQLMQLIVAQGNKPQPDPLSALEKLAPILQLGQKDPAANAAMMEAMGNMQLQQMAMMAQMLETFGGQSDAPSPILEMVKTIAEGMVAMTQAANADQQRARMQQMAQLPAPQPQRQVIQQVPQQRPQAVPAQQPQRRANTPVPYQTIDAAVVPEATPKPMKLNPVMLNFLPAEFQAPEWKHIVVALHEGRPVEQVAAAIARQIGHLDEFNLLPAVLVDYHTNPAASLRALVQPLPVYTENAAYCEQVIDATIQAMLEFGVLQLAEPATDEEESEGEEEEDDVDGDGEAMPGDDVVAEPVN
jgi:hypothetical protein